MSAAPSGPLAGIRVLEVAGIGPITFVCMMLANLGADVLRVNRPRNTGRTSAPELDLLAAHRPAVVVDLRSEDGRDAVLKLCDAADVLVEGMRPGVMERLGVGPEECLARNPRLIYGRVTGFGRTGPLAARAGHDINALAMSGALSLLTDGSRPPVPPLNLLGDYGGGGMLLAFGIACALLDRERSGQGQLVDTSILQGATQLLSGVYHNRAAWRAPSPGEADPGSRSERMPWYRTYETKDRRYMAIGAIEQPFYDELVRVLGLDDELPDRLDKAGWATIESRFTEAFRSRTRAEWERLFEGLDACASPVLSLSEAPAHPHNVAAGLFTADPARPVPGPGPQFERTPGRCRRAVAQSSSADLLDRWGLSPDEQRGVSPVAPITLDRGPVIEELIRGRTGS